MAAGLTVYNNDNKIQIDGAFKNLQLSRKIVLNGTGDTSGTFADGEVLAAVGGTTSQNRRLLHKYADGVEMLC